MANTTPNEKQGEVYTWGYGTRATTHMSRRSASKQAAFFLPYLRPGTRLLDCGCGPGTITVGLAQAVSPGQTVGIDIEASQLDQARALAAGQGLENTSFEQASIYALHFANASFDAVFIHTVLEHLSDPVAALREVYRVLRPGGFAGIREFDESGVIHYPIDPLVARRYELVYQIWRRNGGIRPVGAHYASCCGKPALSVASPRPRASPMAPKMRLATMARP